jgi:hypothetical protein
MDSLFKQTGSVYLDCAAVCGGLTRKFSLDFGRYVNGDYHGMPFQIPPYRWLRFESMK